MHENLKNIRDAQPAGAAIVSFNIPSFLSYGKKQSYNAPVGLESAFKYTTVLNYMLQNNSKQKIQIGDATTVFWAEKRSHKYTDMFSFFLDADIKSDDKKTEEEKTRSKKTEKLINDCFEALNKGKKLSEVDPEIDDETKFYILGLSPNNARVSIRFFHGDTFGNFMKNLTQHHKDLELEGGRFPFIPIWIILEETTIKNSSKDKPTPLLSGRIMEAIVKGGKYPDDLYAAMIRRIRAEQDNREKKTYSINHTRVATIKAYLTRKARIDKNEELKEVLNVSLNEETTNTAYRLGRLFAILERIQIANAKKDNPKRELNSTIKDRFFSSASASPKTVFPNLLKLSQDHLSQLGKRKKGYEIYFQKQLGEIMQGIEAFRSESDNGFPAILTMEEQGLFMLGYYQQRFNKKEDEKETQAETQQIEEIIEETALV